MLILTDNDVGGAVTAIRRILESDEWTEFTSILDLQFIEFEDVELPRDAPDLIVWQRCQEVGAILITGNRSSGAASLEQAIESYAGSDSLPILTIGDPQRVMRDSAYARECAISLLDLAERIEMLRGTGRLFIP